MPMNSTGINAERKNEMSPIKVVIPEINSDEEWLENFLDTMDFDQNENCKYKSFNE